MESDTAILYSRVRFVGLDTFGIENSNVEHFPHHHTGIKENRKCSIMKRSKLS